MAELNRTDSNLAYEEAGAGAPAFVFMRPPGSTAETWAAQIANLSPEHRCISIEIDGAEDAADRVSSLLGALQPGPVLVAAAESSSVTALVLNERYPEAVLGITLVNPELPPNGDDADRLHAETLVKLADKKPFMIIWPERPAGDPSWLRDVTMFVRQEPVADVQATPQLEQPAITNALLRAFLDDVRHDPRIA